MDNSVFENGTGGASSAGESSGANHLTNTPLTNTSAYGQTGDIIDVEPTYEIPIPNPTPSKKQEKAASATVHAAPKKANSSLKTFLIAFAGAFVACIVALGGYSLIGGHSTSVVTTIGGSGSSITVNGEDTTLPEVVSQKCLPSVAAIDVYTSSGYSSYGYSLGTSGELVESSLGSGVVLSEDGYVITNYHVIEGSDALSVTVGGESYEADVVGSDSSSDIAVIKLKNASGLTPIDIGDSDELVVGEWVMTIGSPFGLEQSVATGIVSATARSQVLTSETDGSSTIYPNMIQTDAAINPGNSGGALVDKDGKLVGINTLITSYSGNYSGVGFAIPANYAISIAEKIMNGETITHAQLGVTMGTVTSQNAKQYNLSVTSGVYVSGVSEDSGADKAGIEVGDVIVQFDGKDITSASDLQIAVRTKEVGDKVTVKINRSGKEMELEVELGSDDKVITSSIIQNDGSGSGNSRDYGYNYDDLEELLDEYLNGGGNGNGYGYGYGF